SKPRRLGLQRRPRRRPRMRPFPDGQNRFAVNANQSQTRNGRLQSRPFFFVLQISNLSYRRVHQAACGLGIHSTFGVRCWMFDVPNSQTNAHPPPYTLPSLNPPSNPSPSAPPPHTASDSNAHTTPASTESHIASRTRMI